MGGLLAVATALVATPLGAQGVAIPSLPSKPVMQEVEVPKGTLDKWVTLYLDGDWECLQGNVMAALRPRTGDPAAAASIHTFDFAHNYYRLALVSDRRAPDGEIVQFLVHGSLQADETTAQQIVDDPKGGCAQVKVADIDEPFAQRLPGLTKLYDVFATTNRADERAASYLTTPVPDPFLEKLSAFFSKIDPAALLSRFVRINVAAAADVEILFVHVSEVTLPRRRASIAITDLVNKSSHLDLEKLGLDSAQLAADLPLRTARGSACAEALTPCLDAVLRDAAACLTPDPPAGQDDLQRCLGPAGGGIVSCPLPIPPLPGNAVDSCKGDRDNRRRCLIRKRVSHAYATVIGGIATCAPGARPDFVKEAAVESAYLGLVPNAKPQQLKKDSTYENALPTRRTLGLISSLMVETSGDERVKLDGGKLVTDPLRGAMGLAVVNYHPVGFDPKSEEPTFGERFRLFAGPVITPEFGLGAGVGYAIWRGVSVNVGYAQVRVNTLRRGDRLADPAVAPSNLRRPFRDGNTGVVFVGLGFNF
jgi:hypothetical protein